MRGWSESDRTVMRAALDEARRAADAGEVPVGAVVTLSGEIVGRGHNRSIRNSDPTAHAEIVALRAAARQEQNYRLPGASVFVTLEPCVMCVGAMLQARIARIVFGAYDPDAGAVGSVIDLSMVPAFNHRIEVNGGLLADDAGTLLREFFAVRRG